MEHIIYTKLENWNKLGLILAKDEYIADNGRNLVVLLETEFIDTITLFDTWATPIRVVEHIMKKSNDVRTYGSEHSILIQSIDMNKLMRCTGHIMHECYPVRYYPALRTYEILELSCAT